MHQSSVKQHFVPIFADMPGQRARAGGSCAVTLQLIPQQEQLDCEQEPPGFFQNTRITETKCFNLNRPFADCEMFGGVFLYIPNAVAAELNVYKIIASNHMELAVSKLVL